MSSTDVLVIGGGAAGMMAAVFAAQKGAHVTIAERNEKLGKKIYITGKGRCNMTNNCTTDEFMQEVPRNPRFLYSALSFFSPRDMIQFMESHGCPTTEERGRRVFPSSMKASDVTRTILRELERLNVEVLYNTRISSLITEDTPEGKVIRGAECEKGRIAAHSVIIACGGRSYPATGSTGDGYFLASSLGHNVIPQKGVLCGVISPDEWVRELQGLSLKNVALTLTAQKNDTGSVKGKNDKKGGKILFTEVGEMLFTHMGISGPMVLTMSCHMPDDISCCSVSLDMKPGLTLQQLDARIVRETEENSTKSLKNMLISLLPTRMAEIFPALAHTDPMKKCSQLTHEERQRIVQLMKNIPINVTALAPIDEAIVTRGGIDVKQVNPATMESRIVKGLYFAGEVLDVDCHTGGYNLQTSFSTGALAGANAGEAK